MTGVHLVYCPDKTTRSTIDVFNSTKITKYFISTSNQQHLFEWFKNRHRFKKLSDTDDYLCLDEIKNTSGWVKKDDWPRGEAKFINLSEHC